MQMRKKIKGDVDVISEKITKEQDKEIKEEIEEKEEVPYLVADPFNWEATTASLLAPIKNEINEENEEKMATTNKPLTAAEIEAKTRAAEQRLLDPKAVPETTEDFERLLVSSPNSSMYWIKYMSFYIQSTELDAAREIAQRAISTISIREGQEKLNVWLALLNLEKLYGTKDSLENTLKQALQYNNPYDINMHMVEMFCSSGKIQEAHKLTRDLCKRYRDNKDMWPKLAEFYFKAGEPDKAREIFEMATRARNNNNKEQTDVVVTWAHAENRHGHHEKAQALLEHIITTYPNRVDVWSSYVDILIKQNAIQLARNTLERAVSHSLRARKLASLYKKWVNLEKEHGTPEEVQRVRDLAKQYVDSTNESYLN